MSGASPVAGLVGIDHIFFVVDDLDAGAGALTRMGFVVQPEARHDAGLGTANRLVMFAGDYLELITPRGESTIGTLLRRDLASRGNHCGALVLATGDMAVTLAELAARGFDTPPPITYSREVDFGGRRATARFTTAQIPAFEKLGFRILLIEHATPDLVFPPTAPLHPNGGERIAQIQIGVSDPADAADMFARLLGPGDGGRFRIGGACLNLTAMAGDGNMPFGGLDSADRGIIAVMVGTGLAISESHCAPEVAAGTIIILGETR